MQQNYRRGDRWVFVLFVLASNVLCFNAAADKFYKWVDEDGNTHYGDTAPAGRSQEIHVPRTPVVDPSVNTRKERTRRLLESFQDERTEKRATRDADAAALKKRRANCEQAEQTQYKYEHSAFLYTTDEQGNRVILSDEEHAEAKAKAQNDVEKWCK